MKISLHQMVVVLAALAEPTIGLELQDASDTSAVKETAATIAKNLLGYYTGMNPGDVPGNLPDPYYWWEAGGMFGTLVDYSYFTGDKSHDNITLQAIVHQAGEKQDFMPRNQTLDEGNDDQGFWALTAMNAAEQNFVDPPEGQPQYTALVQAVFNEMVSRWDTENCNGGLRWQIIPGPPGYNYKNTVANGCFFNIAARLGRYTGNTTYTSWANKIWDWTVSQDLISKDFAVYDGAQIQADKTCGDIDKTEWSYNAGLWLHGSAAVYASTKNATWKERVDGILSHASAKFSRNGILFEQFCEPSDHCDQDQLSFKGYFARFLRATSLIVPDTADQILKLLKSSAPTAVSTCIGSGSTYRGTQGQACGFSWMTPGKFDGQYGVGQQMNALSNVIYTLGQKAPVTLHTGGTSKSDPSAGDPNAGNSNSLEQLKPITGADRAGAGIITTLLIMMLLGFCAFLTVDFERLFVANRRPGKKALV